MATRTLVIKDLAFMMAKMHMAYAPRMWESD